MSEYFWQCSVYAIFAIKYILIFLHCYTKVIWKGSEKRKENFFKVKIKCCHRLLHLTFLSPYLWWHEAQLVEMDENDWALLWKLQLQGIVWQNYCLSFIKDRLLYPILKRTEKETLELLSLVFRESKRLLTWLPIWYIISFS